MEQHTNKLIHETSPYLLQHAHNPVNWMPWGEEALKKAREEEKLIFVSIGYAACHWCHVMEKESFENEDLAKKLNRDFVCIKVDRQERPDVDQLFMSAVQLMTGNGGWPLNCYATPDARPFYGGTYFPPDDMIAMTDQLAELWKSDRQRIMDAADNLQEGIADTELIKEKNDQPKLVDSQQIFERLKEEFDTREGGMQRVPKFPMPGIYTFLLRYYHYTGEKQALEHAALTVKKIIRGGIYDQLAGGIARYSTDGKWKVPHFEKMLYDNARFISLLSELYSLTKEDLYKKILYQCTEFLEKEMAGPDGGYFASLDADSEGVEGKYYTWDATEIDAITGRDSEIVKSYFGITKNGNWEPGMNVLSVQRDPADLAKIFGLSVGNVKEIIGEAQNKLRLYREQREKPAADTKILTSWNALVADAYASAWQATGDESFFNSALRTGKFIREKLVSKDGTTVTRSLHGNVNGFLDDYAYTAHAFFSLYQIGFDETWLKAAETIMDKVLADFFNIETGMFFYNPKTETTFEVRHSDVTDHVLPSSNAVMAEVLLEASGYLNDHVYEKMARQMVGNVIHLIKPSPLFFSSWASLNLTLEKGIGEIVITGPGYAQIRNEFTRRFLPGILFAGAAKKSTYPLFRDRFVKGENRIYLCRNGVCHLPGKNVSDILKNL